jgi:hypothetical protein
MYLYLTLMRIGAIKELTSNGAILCIWFLGSIDWIHLIKCNRSAKFWITCKCLQYHQPKMNFRRSTHFLLASFRTMYPANDSDIRFSSKPESKKKSWNNFSVFFGLRAATDGSFNLAACLEKNGFKEQGVMTGNCRSRIEVLLLIYFPISCSKKFFKESSKSNLKYLKLKDLNSKVSRVIWTHIKQLVWSFFN